MTHLIFIIHLGRNTKSKWFLHGDKLVRALGIDKVEWH